MREPPLERLAELIVAVGANVQPGQLVDLWSALGKEELTRAVTVAAYRRGAKFVDVAYYDPHIKRARVEYVEEESLEYIPPWFGERALQLGEARAASISFSGPSAPPDLFEDLDASRLGRDIYPRVKEWMKITNDRTVNWSVAPAPTETWARLVYPDVEPSEALDRLWDAVVHVCRLDDEDPAGAWRERSADLAAAADRLTERRFDALHLEGPGTDLTVGLLPSSSWIGGSDSTAEGIEHMSNLPTEEVFTTPDPERVEGTVRATMPLFTQGTVIEGLRVRFEGGRAVQVEADSGAEILRTLTTRDEGAARLGEIALVDREGRIGQLETVFYDTLLDENAASHIALGSAYEQGVSAEDAEQINDSEIHLDFMIGGPEVDVTGITLDGEHVPVLRDATWQI
jgi:aminopeptidase